MASNDYQFLTRWRVEGAVEDVYDILDDPMDLPRWWPAVYLGVKELAPDPDWGLGRVYELHTRGWLPYTLRWRLRRTQTNRPHGYTIEARGDFVGRGIWRFVANGPFVDVTYDWRLRADKPLLAALSFLLKPVFSANHHWAMRQGEASLKLELARRRTREAQGTPSVPVH